MNHMTEWKASKYGETLQSKKKEKRKNAEKNKDVWHYKVTVVA